MQRLEDLSDAIASLAADIQASTCRWLELIAEFDAREGWAIEGFTSCPAWVSWRCGVGPEAAREYVRVARRLGELPRVRAGFAAGELTYSKVRALTRVEDITREDDLVELARSATAAQLEQVVRAYRGVVRAEAGAEQAFAERFLDCAVEEDGSVRIRGRLPAEQGAVLMRALEIVREEMRADVSAETPAPVGARNADALAQIAETALSPASAGSTGGDRYQLVVHVDASALEGDQGGRSELESGHAPLAHQTALRLACDASVVRIVERDGRPLSVGRKTRSIPPALRRALRSRDGGCQFPGCTHTRHVDAHHVEHWAHGGATDVDNLVQLCRHHHRLVHEGGFSVTRRGARFVFVSPSGRPIAAAPRLRRAECIPLPRVSAETQIQPTTDRLHLDYAVEALLDFAPLGGAGGAGASAETAAVAAA